MKNGVVLAVLLAVPGVSGCGEARGNQQGSDPNIPVNAAPGDTNNNPGLVTPSSLTSATLKVTIEGLKNTSGLLCMTLFKDADGFPDNVSKARAGQCFEISQTPLEFTVTGLEPGIYAMSTFHDENRDGELNKGAFGIPKESLGFSNGAEVHIAPPGPPTFDEARFDVATPETAISIKVKGLLD